MVSQYLLNFIIEIFCLRAYAAAEILIDIFDL